MYSVRNTHPSPRLGQDQKWYWVGAIVVWAVVAAAAWGLGHAYISQFRAERVNAAIERASVAAEALEQTLLRSAEAMESIQSLAQTRHDLIRAGDTAGAAGIADYLAGIAKKEKFGVLQVATIAPDGWMTWSSTGVQERVWLGDREHFLVHLNEIGRAHV